MGQGQHCCPASSELPTPANQRQKNTAQGPERARRAGNGVCTVEHSRAATSNGNGMLAPAIPDPKGSGDQPGARRAAELTGEEGQARSPTQTGCRGQDAGRARARSTPQIRCSLSRNTKEKRQSLQHPPARPEDAASERERSPSSKSRGELMLSSSQADRITQ